MASKTTGALSGSGSFGPGSRHYVMLVFAGDDEVADTQMIRAPNARRATKIAENIMRTYPRSLGYQLWHEGRRVHATYPVAGFSLIAPIALLLRRKFSGPTH